MVGSEPDGSNQIGVAPGAEWISVKALNADGGTNATVLAAAEWILAPTDSEGNTDVNKAPDIVNNSWGGGPGLDEWFRDVVKAWRAAEIFPEFSTGNTDYMNSGGPGSVAAPANYPESFATGATDLNDKVAEFTLLGPSPYGEIKPDISAPGVNIRSSIPGGGYASNNGTSMAGPAVSGVIALMLQANPNLKVVDLEDLLIETATPLTDDRFVDYPNNGYGYGLVNADEAVSMIVDGLGEMSGQVNLTTGEEIEFGQVSIVETERTTMVDSTNGLYRMVHPNGEYTVKAEAYGHYPQVETIKIEKDNITSTDFTLQEIPEGSINGSVTNKSTEKAIEGAKLFLVEDANVTPIETEADGQYNLTAYEGDYTLRVIAWNYPIQEIPVTISKGDMEVNIELEPNYTYLGDQISYDDGTDENYQYSSLAGDGWGVRMSLEDGKETGYLTEATIYLEKPYNTPEFTEFSFEIWDSKGEDGKPDSKIAGPIQVSEKLERGAHWVNVDLRDLQLEVDGDFYVLYRQKGNTGEVPRVMIDLDGKDYGRSLYYVPGKGWNEDDPPIGNFMIRSRVAYDIEKPTIELPVEDIITNDKNITINGTSSPTTSIHLINNAKEVDTSLTDQDGTFEFSLVLDEGENNYTAVSKYEDDPTGESNAVQVTLDTIAPNLSINNPIDGGVTNKESVVVEGDATDNYLLESVKINNEEVDVTDGKYSQRILLDKGDNEIEVIATDAAGNTSVETVSMKMSADVPTINNLTPDTDQYVSAGEKVKVSFESNVENGDANFEVKIPSMNNTHEASPNNMVEVETGIYEGEWTVPAGMNTQGAVIEVSIIDRAGNSTVDQADGKLFISRESLDRISGKNRFETAIEVSKKGWTSADTVILARSDDYADALAGVPLAYKLDAPILLTRGDSLHEATLGEITRLGAKKIIILGGTGAISPAIVTELEEKNLAIDRVSGATRYETAAAIAGKVAPEGVNQVVVANSLDFPDALSVASQAAQKGLPILLTRADELHDTTENTIANLEAQKSIVVGGTLAVSNSVMEQLPGAERVRGADRIGTNIAIQEYFDVDTRHLYVATGNDYADALTGAVLAAKNNSSILLVRNNVSDETSEYIINSNIRKLTIFGGQTAIDSSIANKLHNLIK